MKKHNFNAGPSILPREVIEKTAQAVLDFNGSGLSIMEIHTRHILDMKKRLNQILADNTGQPIDVIAKDTNRDNFMTAQQALEYGLIDKVIEKR